LRGQVITLLKALCGGSNIDIDQHKQENGTRANDSNRGTNATESSSNSNSGSSATQAQPAVWGGLTMRQILFGAAALFLAIV
jgi:hypothetical protein